MAHLHVDPHIQLPVPQVGQPSRLPVGAEVGSVMELGPSPRGSMLEFGPSRRGSNQENPPSGASSLSHNSLASCLRPLPHHALSQGQASPRGRGLLQDLPHEGSKTGNRSRKVSIQTGMNRGQSSTESSFHDLMTQALIEHDREVRDLRRQIHHSGYCTPTDDKFHDPKKNQAELSALLQERLGAAGDTASRADRRSLSDPDVRDADIMRKGGSRSVSICGSDGVKSKSRRHSANDDAKPNMMSIPSSRNSAASEINVKKSLDDDEEDVVMFQLHALWLKESKPEAMCLRTQMSLASFGSHARTRSMFSANLGENSPLPIAGQGQDKKRSLTSGSTTMSAGAVAFRQMCLSCRFCCSSRGCWRIWDKLVVYPNSLSRIFWDILGSIFLMLDVLLVPLEAFQQERPFRVVEIINWVVLIFWTTDIIASQFVGYTEGGVLEMRFKYIVVHYCKTWLVVDFVLVGLDWTFIIAKKFAEVASLSGLMRLLRLLRILRLVRMLKMSRIMRELSDLLASEHTSIVVNITRLVLILLLVNHGVACCWFWLGTGADAPNWIENYEVDHATFAYRYFTSMHWSLAQFTPGSMEIHPFNVAERVFNVCVLVFGLLVFSCFVSSMTNHFMRLKALVENESQQFWLLRCYLKQHRAPAPLCSRIYRHVEFMLKKRNDVLPATKVKLLEYISSDLMNELSFAMFKEVVLEHPFFYHLWRLSDVVVMRLCGSGVSNQMYARGDPIFFQAETGKTPYFVMSGTAIYKIVRNNSVVMGDEGDHDTDNDEGIHEVVESESIIAEASLWTPSWVHRGRLHAKTECTLVAINSDIFRSIIEASPPLWQFVRFYAINYVGWLNQQPTDELTDIFDIVMFKWQIEAFLPDLEELDQTVAASPSFNMMSSLNSALDTIRESIRMKSAKNRVSAAFGRLSALGGGGTKMQNFGPELLRPPESRPPGRPSHASSLASPAPSSGGSFVMSDSGMSG